MERVGKQVWKEQIVHCKIHLQLEQAREFDLWDIQPWTNLFFQLATYFLLKKWLTECPEIYK